MQRGRKPKTADQHALHGTKRPDRQPRSNPRPRAGAMQPTPQVDRIPEARRYWDHYVATAPLGMLAPVDAPLLERLCVALAIAEVAMDQILRRGLAEMIVIKVGADKDGAGDMPQINPYLSAVNRQTEIARKLAAELGLPVAARARLEASDVPPPNPGDEDDDTPRARRSRENDLDSYLDQHPDRTLN